MADVQLINIIYNDKERTEHMCERIDGYLLPEGEQEIDRIHVRLRRVGHDKVYTSGQRIISIYRFFDSLKGRRADET